MSRTILFTSALLCATVSFAQNGFTLTTDIGGQASMREVYNGFGCTGENRSPLLTWSGAPEGTQSYAVTMHDADAPTGSGWWHWVAFDMPNTTMGLPAGAGTPGMPGMPSIAVQSRTDFGGFGYGGPCPPPGHGPHQYIITVYALKNAKLGLDQNASPAGVGYALNNQMLAKASVVFYYGR